MPGIDADGGAPAILDQDGLDRLIAVLRDRGFRVIGPRAADGAISYDQIDGIADLPAGWGDEQDGGRYRLVPRGDGALFGYTAGAQGWKRFLYPPHQKLFAAERRGGGRDERGDAATGEGQHGDEQEDGRGGRGFGEARRAALQ